MTIESTLPSHRTYSLDRWSRVTLSDQRKALAALDRIIELHPNLPAAYITLSFTSPHEVDVQAQSWHALEAWRVALNVAPAEVRPGICAPEREHLEFEATVDGVPVRVYVVGRSVQLVEDSAVSA